MGRNRNKEFRITKFVYEEIENIESDVLKNLIVQLIRVERSKSRDKNKEYIRVFSDLLTIDKTGENQ